MVNNTLKVVNEVYASPVAAPGWGHDRLGADVVPPGGRQLIRLPGGDCLYDVRVVYQQGGAEERRNIDTCGLGDLILGGGAAAPRNAPQGNPSFNLVNQSARPIREVFATPASRRDWGPDLLGATVLAPGRRQAVRLPAGPCLYDLRIVWDGGRVEERRGVDLCQVTDLPFR